MELDGEISSNRHFKLILPLVKIFDQNIIQERIASMFICAGKREGPIRFFRRNIDAIDYLKTSINPLFAVICHPSLVSTLKTAALLFIHDSIPKDIIVGTSTPERVGYIIEDPNGIGIGIYGSDFVESVYFK
jgi:hypothetical protein